MDAPGPLPLLHEGPNWAEVWIAYGTVALAVATVLLVVAGLWQLRALRLAEKHSRVSAREWETLRACQLYDIDPVLEAASHRIYSAARRDSTASPDYSLASKRDAITLMNYLDGLAIGIRQGLYEEEIVKDQLSGAVKLMVEKIGPAVNYPTPSFTCLIDLHKAWSAEKNFYRSPL